MPLLYKYLPHERMTFFSDGLLRMTQPGDLNDPLECLSFSVNIDPGAYIELDLDRQRQEYGAVTGQQINPLLFDLIRKCARADVVRAEQIRADLTTSCYKSFVDFVNSSLGIISFSKTWKSLAMWAHYTAGHKGFCIGFEQPYTSTPLEHPTITLGSYHDVKYQERRTIKDVTTGVAVEPHMLFVKSKDWEYEEEVRVIYELTSADEQSADLL